MPTNLFRRTNPDKIDHSFHDLYKIAEVENNVMLAKFDSSRWKVKLSYQNGIGEIEETVSEPDWRIKGFLTGFTPP